MLVLTRRAGETLRIADDILVTIVEVKSNQVRLGIDSPADVTVLREELVQPDPKPLAS
jgi:carbon storage regulator